MIAILITSYASLVAKSTVRRKWQIFSPRGDAGKALAQLANQKCRKDHVRKLLRGRSAECIRYDVPTALFAEQQLSASPTFCDYTARSIDTDTAPQQQVWISLQVPRANSTVGTTRSSVTAFPATFLCLGLIQFY